MAKLSVADGGRSLNKTKDKDKVEPVNKWISYIYCDKGIYMVLDF